MKRAWINASPDLVREQILDLERRQGDGLDWDPEVDGGRLNALRLTAKRLREQNAPLREDLKAAQNKVSRVPILPPKDRELIAGSD